MTEMARFQQKFRPRKYQRSFMRYFERGGKRAMWVMHRRGGKDLTALHQTCRMAARRRGAYWHVFPIAEQARKAIWEGFTKDGERIMDQVFPEAIRRRPKTFAPGAEMVVELKNGSIWRLMGSDKMEVVGAGPVGVVFSEFALAKPKTWDLIRPMLRENDGWAAFITTPRGPNHAKKLFDIAKADPSWFCELLSLYDTRAYDPEQTIAEERASGMPEALIRQEYLCDWTAALVGSVYGDLIEALEKAGRVCDFDHSKDAVFAVFDLGVSDATAIWFFRINADGYPDLIDWYEATGQPMQHYFEVLESKPYRYSKIWLPHDARARTFQTGVSTLEQFIKRFGAALIGLVPELSIADGIMAARWLLQQAIRIHQSKCEEGLERLRMYRYEWDDDRKVFSKKPVHDWTSHAADDFRYLACAFKASGVFAEPKPIPKPPPGRTIRVTLDEALQIHDSETSHRRRL